MAATPSFSDLVLNCLALAFVVDLDQLFYDALIPFSQKQQVASTQVRMRQHLDTGQAITLNHLQCNKTCLKDLLPYARCFAWAIGSVVSVWLYISKFQTVLSN